MKDFLVKLKLIDYLKIELDVKKHQFIERFASIVDRGDIGMFSGSFEAFSSSPNEFKGFVDMDGFKIRKIRKLFDMHVNFAVAKGRCEVINGKLNVTAEINGFHNMMIFFYAFCILFYSVFFIVIIGAGFSNENEIVLVLPFLVFHAAFMLGIPYFMMKRGVKRMKCELEREFVFLTSDSFNTSRV